MEIVERNIHELIPAEYNPRKLSAKQKEDITASITRFGLVDPILINIHPERKDIIIGGHQRTLIAKELGYETMPCVEISLTLDKERELNIRLNKNTGDWDEEILAELFNEEELLSFGFEELDPALGLFHIENEPEEDEWNEPLTETPRSEPGKVYQLGEHRLMCGDGTRPEEVFKLMAGKLADQYITDPPYNVNYEGATKDKLTIKNDSMDDEKFITFLKDLFEAAANVLKPGGAFYIWHADGKGYEFRYACKLAELEVRQNLIWNKNGMVMGRQDYQWKHEPCLYGWKDGAPHFWNSNRSQTTIFEFDKPRANDIHPTMKPIPMMAYLIRNSSKKGQIVYDSCGGSGSTLIAADQIGRVAYLMELDPRYCDATIERYCRYKGIDADSIFNQ